MKKATREHTRSHNSQLILKTLYEQSGMSRTDPAQADLVAALHELGHPTVTVAARTPYDLLAYPQATTHICTYSIQPASMQALAAALVGEAAFPGRLPVQIPGSAAG